MGAAKVAGHAEQRHHHGRGCTGYRQGAMDMGVAEAELATVEFAAHGDTAWEVGQGVLKTKEGQVIDNAKYIVIWKREHGAWKWHRDIWNSSQPAG